MVDVVGVEVFEGKLFGVGVLWWMWLGWKCLRENCLGLVCCSGCGWDGSV